MYIYVLSHVIVRFYTHNITIQEDLHRHSVNFFCSIPDAWLIIKNMVATTTEVIRKELQEAEAETATKNEEDDQERSRKYLGRRQSNGL